jgi:hypothetical protein
MGPALIAAMPAISAGLQGLFGLFGAKSANKASDRAANLQYQATLRSLAMQEAANREQMAFLRDQEATRQREFKGTQDLNLRLYNEGVQRREPFRQFAIGSLRQLSNPIGPQASSMSLRGMVR